MTEALNYVPKAIEGMMSLASQPNMTSYNKQGLNFIASLLGKAEVFVLPDAGELLDRSKAYPEVPGQIFRPPFPVVALEYRATKPGGNDPLYEASLASKRIALAWEWDGRMPAGGGSMADPSVGDGVVIASIAFFDNVQRWIPISAAVMIPFDCEYRVGPKMPHEAALIASGRITPKQAAQKKIEIRAILPLVPNWLHRTMQTHGQETALSMMAADLMDEVNAYRDLCLALACNNVSSAQHAAPPKLNRSRIKAGKMPLKDFHVLEIAGHDEGSAFGTGGGNMRSHLRRGHIRRLGADRITWVNACMVRGSRPGFVDKQYAMGSL